MRALEYILSVTLALLVLGALAVWTQAAQASGHTALSCRPGKAAAAVTLRGMSLYPRCPGGKTS